MFLFDPSKNAFPPLLLYVVMLTVAAAATAEDALVAECKSKYPSNPEYCEVPSTPEWLKVDGLHLIDLCHFAEIAYEPQRLLRTLKKSTVLPTFGASQPYDTNFVLQMAWNEGDTDLVTVYNHKRPHLIIAFRGTSSVGDILSDINTRTVPWPFESGNVDFAEVEVHSGFIDQYAAVRHRLFDHIKSYIEAGAKVTVTGHSLGAALATVAAADIGSSFQLKQELNVITFGSPRAGKQEFVDAYRQVVSNTLRVVNRGRDCLVSLKGKIDGGSGCEDKITQIPPATLLNFKHVTDKPTLVYIETGLTIFMGPSFDLRLHGLTNYEEGLYTADLVREQEEEPAPTAAAEKKEDDGSEQDKSTPSSSAEEEEEL